MWVYPSDEVRTSPETTALSAAAPGRVRYPEATGSGAPKRRRSNAGWRRTATGTAAPPHAACQPGLLPAGGGLFAGHGGCRGFAGGLRCLAAGDAELFSAMLVRALFGFLRQRLPQGCSAPSMRPLPLRQRCCFCWACPLWGR